MVDWLARLYPRPCFCFPVLGLHACTNMLCGCWGFEIRSTFTLHSKPPPSAWTPAQSLFLMTSEERTPSRYLFYLFIHRRFQVSAVGFPGGQTVHPEDGCLPELMPESAIESLPQVQVCLLFLADRANLGSRNLITDILPHLSITMTK